MLGDGVCDPGCFTKECEWDLGDCADKEIEPTPEASKIKPSTSKTSVTKDRCAEGCPFLWIGDGVRMMLSCN